MKNIFLLTDIGIDPDDALAVWLLANLHNAGKVNLIGAVVNTTPAQDRARLLYSIWRDLGIDVPVGEGLPIREHSVKPYELSYPNLTSKQMPVQKLVWDEFYAQPDKSVTLLIIAPCADIWNQIADSPKFKDKLKEVYMMGGAKFVVGGSGIEVDPTATNNKWSPAQDIFNWFVNQGIPTYTLTRHAAYELEVGPEFYARLVGSPIGDYLNSIQKESLHHLWQYACSNPPDHRQNRAWFAKRFCKMDEIPIGADGDPWPYVKQLNLYDPLTVMWMIVPLYFSPGHKTTNGTLHQIVGFEGCQNILPDRVMRIMLEVLNATYT